MSNILQENAKIRSLVVTSTMFKNITALADTYKYIQTHSNTYFIIYLQYTELHRTYAQMSYVPSHHKARSNDLIVFD